MWAVPGIYRGLRSFRAASSPKVVIGVGCAWRIQRGELFSSRLIAAGVIGVGRALGTVTGMGNARLVLRYVGMLGGIGYVIGVG